MLRCTVGQRRRSIEVGSTEMKKSKTSFLQDAKNLGHSRDWQEDESSVARENYYSSFDVCPCGVCGGKKLED